MANDIIGVVVISVCFAICIVSYNIRMAYEAGMKAKAKAKAEAKDERQAQETD